MEMLDLRLRLPKDDLLDASDEVARLLDREYDELLPPFRRILFAIDEAITEAYMPRSETTLHLLGGL